MATGHIEALRRGFRAVVYAGKDPLTGRKTYLKETHPTREAAERAKNRLIAQVEAERIPDRAATVAYLLDRWVEVADHELSTRVTNEGYIRRTLKPALGEIPLRKLQHRVDIPGGPPNSPTPPGLRAGPSSPSSHCGFAVCAPHREGAGCGRRGGVLTVGPGGRPAAPARPGPFLAARRSRGGGGSPSRVGSRAGPSAVGEPTRSHARRHGLRGDAGYALAGETSC